jgi:hypothetical protein
VTIHRRIIPEQRHPSGRLRLGRHVEHDSRSRAYAHPTEGLKLVSAIHPRRIPILDQGDLGSCTGNAAAGVLATEPDVLALTAGQVAGIDERFAVGVYSAATKIDEFPGTYPPTDTGSSGLAVAKVLTSNRWTAGYTHTFSLDDALLALTTLPVMVGIPWYDSFDEPDQDGYIAITRGAQIRGGHEVEIREIDAENQLVWLDNSWGPLWGYGGRACMSWDTWGRLLDEEGDVTIPTPLTTTPTPALDRPTAADIQLRQALHNWEATKAWPS